MAFNPKDLGGPLLASVSRSLYLSIRLLPRKLRAPVGLAYLLARASDTIADSAQAPEATRLQHLAAFERMIRTGKPQGLDDLQRDIHTEHAGETMLLCNLDRCLQWLAILDSKDRGEVVDVLEKIIRGQTLDLERFGGRDVHVVALQSAEELDEYTYLVAGCVGEFWTRVCLNHLPGCSTLGLAELRKLGAEYGKGLQLVNILRDFNEDLRNGRCYLPEPELRAAGTSPTPLLDAPAKAQPVYDRWRERAIVQLEAGYEYITTLRSARLRAACFLPWFIGLRTLNLLARPGTLERTDKVKVPRTTVRFAFACAAASAFSERALAWSYQRATGKAPPAPITSEESSSPASP
jgi:farnesyl-diphosphate farnesyltransferase